MQRFAASAHFLRGPSGGVLLAGTPSGRKPARLECFVPGRPVTLFGLFVVASLVPLHSTTAPTAGSPKRPSRRCDGFLHRETSGRMHPPGRGRSGCSGDGANGFLKYVRLRRLRPPARRHPLRPHPPRPVPCRPWPPSSRSSPPSRSPYPCGSGPPGPFHHHHRPVRPPRTLRHGRRHFLRPSAPPDPTWNTMMAQAITAALLMIFKLRWSVPRTLCICAALGLVTAGATALWRRGRPAAQESAAGSSAKARPRSLAEPPRHGAPASAGDTTTQAITAWASTGSMGQHLPDQAAPGSPRRGSGTTQETPARTTRPPPAHLRPQRSPHRHRLQQTPRPPSGPRPSRHHTRPASHTPSGRPRQHGPLPTQRHRHSPDRLRHSFCDRHGRDIGELTSHRHHCVQPHAPSRNAHVMSKEMTSKPTSTTRAGPSGLSWLRGGLRSMGRSSGWARSAVISSSGRTTGAVSVGAQPMASRVPTAARSPS